MIEIDIIITSVHCKHRRENMTSFFKLQIIKKRAVLYTHTISTDLIPAVKKLSVLHICVFIG
jgi:hypothetical protein